MSRREDRSSDSKRHRSRFDREPSPKRSRRDGKQETERPNTNAELDKERSDRDHKHRRRLQDPLPLEASSAQDAKIETGSISKASENKTNGHQGGTKHSSDSSKVPQARSFFQHDDRGSAGQNGRSFGGRTDNARGWWRDPKEQQNDPRKDEKSKDNREDNWRHDGYFKMESNSKPPLRKRPSFREQKITADQEKNDKAATDTPKAEDPVFEGGRRTERGHTSRHSEKPERDLNKTEAWNGNFSSRDRYSGSSRYRENDRFNGRQGQGYNRPTGGRAEKWKHDLYDEANKSPTPKNEEEQIANIEALLSS
ncbi:hypothetical protein BUALT_Bualt19G0102800 [Buddleja alternifolia]|uniref:Btz domain-containing protein n=1 Tax=Buddleja alternifolia TaxID=168488 RepID=A0AAV6WAY5_9LAMI|nr:hypothetical protein BUALT_Bualt19G0102800 [Buddleja alternifolia]